MRRNISYLILICFISIFWISVAYKNNLFWVTMHKIEMEYNPNFFISSSPKTDKLSFVIMKNKIYPLSCSLSIDVSGKSICDINNIQTINSIQFFIDYHEKGRINIFSNAYAKEMIYIDNELKTQKFLVSNERISTIHLIEFFRKKVFLAYWILMSYIAIFLRLFHIDKKFNTLAFALLGTFILGAYVISLY